MRKPECVFSEPVRVSTDELLTELLRRLPEDQVTAALAAACDNAQRRTTVKRHIRYKCQRFFRRLTERFGTVPDELATAVGLQGRQLTLNLPTAPTVGGLASTLEAAEEEIEPGPTAEPEALNEYELALERFAKAPCESTTNTAQAAPEASSPESGLSPDSQVDEFLPDFSTYGFEDLKSVFHTYPYVKVLTLPGYDPLLVLGYASMVNKIGQLVRRNLAVSPVSTETETMFNGIVSIFGHLRRKNGDVHQHIKVLTYRPGMLVRCWTNVRGVGDRLEQSRFVYCEKQGLRLVTAAEYYELLRAKLR